MMNRMWLAALALPGVLVAQDISLDMFSALLPRAKDKVEISLDGGLLQLATRWMNDKDPEQAQVKNALSGLKGIYVRSLKFEKPGAYSEADVERIRAQLKGWSTVVSVQEANKRTGIYMKTDGQKVQGLVILTADPQELTVVDIVGSINLDQVKELGGNFGIPDLSGVPTKPVQKKEE